MKQNTGTPIPGAMVVLADTAGREWARTLTNASGHFMLRAPRPGTYRVRADRIGYESSYSEWLELAAGERVSLRLAASARSIVLEGIVAEGERRCVLRPELGMATHRVWREARKALRATVLAAAQERALRYAITRYDRIRDPETMRIRGERRRQLVRSAVRPFESIPIDELLENGFVQPAADSIRYYAPDARVLLSEAFLDTHCFRLRRGTGERAGLIGLAFEPVPGRDDVSEIEGTLWLDEESAELRSLEFGYTNLDLGVPSEQFGGRVQFRQLPSGLWIVSRWRLRGPVLGVVRQTWRMGGFGGGVRTIERTVLAGIDEEVGIVTRVLRPGEEVGPAFAGARRPAAVQADSAVRATAATDSVPATIALDVRLVDRASGNPIERAVVRVLGTELRGTTDEDGRFSFPAVPRSAGRLAVRHPSYGRCVLEIPMPEGKSGVRMLLRLPEKERWPRQGARPSADRRPCI